MTKLGMVIDLNKCIGCHTCVNSCKMQNNVPMGMLWNRVLSAGSEELDGVQGVYPNLEKKYIPVACQHCENAACVKVCPVEATYKAEDGKRRFATLDLIMAIVMSLPVLLELWKNARCVKKEPMTVWIQCV